MNQKPTPERLAYRQKQLAGLDKVLEALPEDSVLAKQHAAAAATRIRKNPTPGQTHAKRTPDKLPDPWLFDSESLLRELDRCRELVLQIPIADHHATHFGINVAVDALWNLRETLRELLRIRCGWVPVRVPVPQANRNYVSLVAISAGASRSPLASLLIAVVCEPTFAPTIATLEFSAGAFNPAYIPKPKLH